MQFGSYKNFVSIYFGNLLELYDFVIYGYFASILGSTFFNAKSHFLTLMLSFVVFASGLIIRPFSAAIYGYLGDKYGRKKILIFTVGIMTIATAGIGFLPSYQQIGIAAPIILIMLRLVQALSVSGEQIAAVLLMMEVAPKRQKSFAGALAMSSIYCGLFLGSVIALAMTHLISKDNLENWGLRIPFIITLLFGGIAFFIRLKQPESPAFTGLLERGMVLDNPLTHAFKKYLSVILYSICLLSLMSVSVYILAVYIPNNSLLGVTNRLGTVTEVSAYGFLLTVTLIVLFGYFTKYTQPLNLLKSACVGTIILAYPIFALINKNSLQYLLLAETILSILLSLNVSSVMYLLFELFPNHIRFTGMSIAFNLSMAIFGGTAPIIALYISHKVGNQQAASYELIVIALLTLILARLMPNIVMRTKNNV